MRRIAMIALTFAALLAWPTASAQAQQGEEILQYVPADALGFAVVGNLEQATGKIDQFIADIGMADALPARMLQMLKDNTGIDAGLNESGSVGVVVLNPESVGMTMDEAFNGAEPPPFAILVPGDDPEEIFANFQPEEGKGGMMTVVMPGGDTGYVMAMGNHSVLSPSSDVIRALSDVEGAIRPSAGDADVLAGSDIFIWVNMAALSPLIDAGMDAAMAGIESGQMPGADPEVMMALQAMLPVLPMYQDMLTQMDSLSLGLHIGQEGVTLNAYAGFASDSVWGRAFSGLNIARSAVMDRLPALDYVLAYSVNIGNRDLGPMHEVQQEAMDALRDSQALAMLSAEAREDLLDGMQTMNEELRGAQVYMGGPAGQSGLFGMAMVMDTDDAAETAAGFAQVFDAMGQAIAANSPDGEQVEVQYLTGDARLSGVDVDAIVITGPMDEDDRAEIDMVMGEPRLAIYLAQIDNETLVMTMGGGSNFAAQAISAARAGKGLDEEDALQTSLAALPENRFFTMAISPTNLLSLVQRGMVTVMGDDANDEQIMALQLTTEAPITVGAAPMGPGVRKALFVPTPLVGEAIPMVMQIIQMIEGGGPNSGY